MDEILQFNISTDARENQLDGSRCYKLRLPPDIPVCNFWSLIVYDTQTNLMIQTEQSWPSVHSNCKKLLINPDGSVDVWLSPTVPTDKEHNWVITTPGQTWYLIVRLYDLKEPLENISWKPDQIEEVK